MNAIKADVPAIVDRMKTLIDVSKDTALSDYLGSAKSTISLWKRRGTIPIDECIDLALKKNASLDWLILGRGKVTIDEKEPAPAAPTDDGNELVRLPLFDMARGTEDAEQAAWWHVPRAWLKNEGLTVDDSAAVRVVGDSHAGGIEHGQIVLIDKRPRDKDGVYLVRFGGSLRIKRVQHMVDGSLRLTADREVYAPDLVVPDKAGAVEFIGACCAAFRRVT